MRTLLFLAPWAAAMVPDFDMCRLFCSYIPECQDTTDKSVCRLDTGNNQCTNLAVDTNTHQIVSAGRRNGPLTPVTCVRLPVTTTPVPIITTTTVTPTTVTPTTTTTTTTTTTAVPGMSTQVLSCEGLCQFTPACAGSVCANSECVGLFWQPNGQGLCAAGSSAYCDPTTFEPVKCLELL